MPAFLRGVLARHRHLGRLLAAYDAALRAHPFPHTAPSCTDVEDHLPGAARLAQWRSTAAKRLTSARAGFVPTFPFWESNASRLGMYRDLLITRSRSKERGIFR